MLRGVCLNRTPADVPLLRCASLQVLMKYCQTKSAVRRAVRVETLSKEAEQQLSESVFNAAIQVDDHTAVFKTKPLREIVRALLVFSLCKNHFLVKHSLQLMKLGKKCLGQNLYNRLMKATIYGQFVAGETETELADRVECLLLNGIGPMLCVPIEEDAGETLSVDEKYNKNLETILRCIRLSHAVDKRFPMSQIKITALIPGDICAHLSDLYPNLQKRLDALDACIRALDGQCIHLRDLDTNTNKVINVSLARLKAVGEMAEKLQVRLLLDAEYTYLNPALRMLAMAMMIKFNKERPLVAYTYQNYLKVTYQHLVEDTELVRTHGSCFAVKLVRGAYMTKERLMATEEGYEDPVHPTFEDTTKMYNRSMDFLFECLKKDPEKFFVVIASHNELTVQRALQEMKARNIAVNDGSVIFGQLYGMSDYLSFALGLSGYTVYKSTPYGPVDETIPYLHRRAMENSSVLSGTHKERLLLWRAFIDRVKFKKVT